MTIGHEHRRKRFLGIIHRLLAGDNTLSTCCGIRALERMGSRDEGTRRRLVDLLNDPDPDVRMDAAAAAGRIGIGQAIEPLTALLTGDSEGEVRIQAVIALSRIGTEETLDRLIDCVRQEGYPELDLLTDDAAYGACWEVQSQALEGLGRIGHRRAATPIIELLRNDDYEALQESGYRVLARLDARRAKEFLLDRLADGGALARRRAARALGTLLENGSGTGQEPGDVLDGLLASLSDPTPQVRAAAAGALGQVCVPRTVGPLTQMLTDPDPEVRGEAASVLGRMQGAEVVERLHDALGDPAMDTRRRVVRVLGEIGDRASFDPLLAMTETAHEGLLADLIGAIGQIGKNGAEERIAEILADRSAGTRLRVQAALALGVLVVAPDFDGAGDDGVGEDGQAGLSPLAVIGTSIFDADKAVALAALSALTRIDPRSAQGTLTELVCHGTGGPGDRMAAGGDDAPELDPFAGIRDLRVESLTLPNDSDPGSSTLASILASRVANAAAADNLGELPSEQPHGPAPTPTVRVHAARLLGTIGEPGSDAVAVLIEQAQSGAPELQREALESLAAIGDADALPAIRAALHSERMEIRLAALDALGRFGGAAAADVEFARLLDDPDPVIRERAVRALSAVAGAAKQRWIVRALEDDELSVCAAALQAVSGQLDADYLGEAILATMFRFSGELRFEAAAALRRIGDGAGADALLDALDDEDREEDHWICLDALAEIYAAAGAGDARRRDHAGYGRGSEALEVARPSAMKAG